MFTLYGQELYDPSTAELAMDQQSWQRMEAQVAELLRNRGQSEAEKVLWRCRFRPLTVRQGTRLELAALHAKLPLAEYVWATELAEASGGDSLFRTIAEAFGEYGFPVDLMTAHPAPPNDTSAV